MTASRICVCGNEWAVSENNQNTEVRCPRCGRLLSADKENPLSDAAPPVHVTQAEATAAFAFRTNLSEKTRGNDATTQLAVDTPPSVTPSVNSNRDDASADSEASLETLVFNEDSETPVLSDDFFVTPSQEIVTYTAETIASVPQNRPKDKPRTDTPLSSGHRRSSSHIDVDLSQRVMGTISHPVVPRGTGTDADMFGIHRVLRTHQRGGMGRILIVYDQYLKRDVALKELHPEVAEDESIVRRFIGEAEITAQLEHPGIVPIHTLDLDKDGFPYYTMKLIKGYTFQEAIKTYHRYPSQQELMGLIRRLVSICKTMAFAHSKGVIHRDLKPANIMLGEHGETLVMDWGLAKPFTQNNSNIENASVAIEHHQSEPRPELTMVGAIVGTPAFMSPEQASPENSIVGPLSDIFSLGTVLYYLLAGQTAFSGRNTHEVLNKVRDAAPMRPSEIKSGVPLDLEAICLKAMSKEPEDRYQGAMEMADDLCRWLDGEPVNARPETALQKIRRWFNKHRLISLTTPALLVLLAAFTSIVVSYRVSRLEHSQNELVKTLLENSVDLTDYPEVVFEGSPNVVLSRDPRQTGGILLTCNVPVAPASEQGVIQVMAPYSSRWNITYRKHLTFSLFEGLDKPGELSRFFVRIGQGSSYFEFRPEEAFWANRKRSNWFPYFIPLDGNEVWHRTESGSPTMSKIEWVEFHFGVKEPLSFRIDNISFR